MKHTNYLKTFLCLSAAVAFVGCSGTRYNRSTGQYIDDKATAGRVKSAFVKDSLVKASDIQVQSFRGNVHLTGFVDHPAQKERASQLTRNIKGVAWFKNDVVIKDSLPGETQSASEPMNEPAGANRDNSMHRQSFQRHNSSGAQNDGWQKGSINIYDPAAEVSSRPSSSVGGTSSAAAAATRNSSEDISSEPAGSNNAELNSTTTSAKTDATGKITLRGTVGSDEQKRMIENQLKTIQGVEVDNKLEVQKP